MNNLTFQKEPKYLVGVRFWRMTYPIIPRFKVLEYGGGKEGSHFFIDIKTKDTFIISHGDLLSSRIIKPFLYNFARIDHATEHLNAY